MFECLKQKQQAQAPERGTQTYAVLPAAGSSSRMGSNKLLMELNGVPVLVRTLRVFQACDAIDGIVIACRAQDIPGYRALCDAERLTKVVKIVEGGRTREHSVLQGILACGEDVGVVAIHDAARPLVTEDLICRTVDAAKRDSAAAPAVALKDSIKRVKNGRLVENIERSSLAAVQTPQCFDIALIRAALTKALARNLPLTDDCGAVEALGQPTTMTDGDYENIKITTPEDILIGEAILKGREA